MLLCPSQDDSDNSIECVNEERRLHKKVCNVSYPFFRAKAKVEAEGPGREGQKLEPGEQGANRGPESRRRVGGGPKYSFFLGI